MAKLLLKLKGQPGNMGPEHLFTDQKHFDGWLKDVAALLPNAKVTKNTLTFDGGTGIIEEKPNDFTN